VLLISQLFLIDSYKSEVEHLTLTLKWPSARFVDMIKRVNMLF